MIDWEELENEFMNTNLSISAFLKSKKVADGSSTRKHTKDWNQKRAKKNQKIKEKTQEKIIEQQSTENANMSLKINEMAQYLINLLPTLEINNTRDYKSASSALKDIRDIVVNDDKDGGIDDATFNNTLAKLLTRRDE